MSVTPARKSTTWLIQFQWLLWRSFVDSYRNPAVHALRIAQKIAIALLVGLCYNGVLDVRGPHSVENVQGALFVLTTENTFPALYGALAVFPGEWPVFEREARAGLYGPTAYYVSKVVALLPGFLVETVTFVTVAYGLMGLRPDWPSFLLTLAVLTVTCNTAAACGTAFSAAFESVPLAVGFLIPFDYLLFITGGVLISLDALPEYAVWTKYLSWFLYTNEALSGVQWANVTGIGCDPRSLLPCPADGGQVLQRYGFAAARLPVDIVSMLLLYLIFHILGLLALIRRSKAS